MKLTKIEGPPTSLKCAGCARTGIGGTDEYLAASDGEARTPEEWYEEEDVRKDLSHAAAYCRECAAKMVETDPTRAVHQFFSDTKGNEIEPEHLPDL